jgi:GNAT superfamily N-acetyltransferase
MDEYFKIVGQINYTFTRITFIVSQYLHEFGLESSHGSFFAKLKSEKFKSLHKEITKISKDKELIIKVKDWSDRLSELIKSRNELTHSLVLTSLENEEKFHLYNYKSVGKKIEQKVIEIDINELRDLNKSFIGLHNEGFELFSQIEKTLPSISIFKSDQIINRWSELESLLKNDSDVSGFYQHLDFIRRKYYQGKVVIALTDNEIVGFASYSIAGGIANVELFQISSAKRRAGYGRMFARKLIQHFRELNCIAISGSAEERETSKFWLKVGFRKVDDSIKGIGFSHYFPLVDSLETKGQKNGNVMIEIWNPYGANSIKINKKWVWKFNINSISSNSCILMPVNLDWRLRLTVNKEVLGDEVIKYIKPRAGEITIGYFLYIPDLKEFVSQDF